MANEKLLTGANVMGLVGDSSTNYINKINDGTNDHDLTVVNGIRFFNGKSDESGVKWDGIQELQVIIPTLADIVSNPVVLKGVVNSAADIPSSASNGDLLYIGTDGTYWEEACEAGDMAIYYNGAWHVISGENQVSLAGGTKTGTTRAVVLDDSATKVIEVEGESLTLAVDYADIYSKISGTANASKTYSLDNGATVVSGMRINLSQASGSTKDISKSVSIDLPSALASGDVTISDKVLASGDFTFASGSFPTISKNAAAIAVTASHNMTVVASGTGDFVTAVDAIKGVALEDGNSSQKDIAYVASLSSIAGTSFVSGIHAWTNADGETPADFEVPGAVSAASTANTFVSGLSAAATSGDLVSSITVGTVSVVEGAGLLTGTTSSANTFVSSVTFGSVMEDTTKDWFVTGLTTGSDVVTDVTVGAVSLIADNGSSFASNAMVSASVSNHVLTFNTGSFMKPVALSKVADTITKGGFSTGGVKLDGFSQLSDTFTTGSLNQAATSVSFKNVLTKAVELTQGTAVKYYFDKEQDHNYEAVMGYKKLNLTSADVTKSGAALSNTAITATIPADTVAVGLNAGTLPSLTIGAPSATISGTVGTALTTSSVSWLAIDDSKKSFEIPGAYSLVSVSEGGLNVAVPDTYDTTGTVTISANEFVADVTIDASSIITKA